MKGSIEIVIRTGNQFGVVALTLLLGLVSRGCGSSQSKLQKEQMQAAASFQAARQQINDMSVSLESARLEIDELEQALAEATNRIKALEQPISLVIRDDARLGILSLDKRGLIVLSEQRTMGIRVNTDGIVITDQNGAVRASLKRSGKKDQSTLTLGALDQQSTSIQLSVSQEDASMIMRLGPKVSIVLQAQDTAQGRFSAINFLDKYNKLMWTTTVTSDGTVIAGKTAELTSH